MGTLTRLNSRTVFFVAITAFSIGALACFGGVTAKQSGKLQKTVQVQSSCSKGNGKTTVAAGAIGSENDKYVCVGECRVVKMCLLQYCYNETVCDPCAGVVVV